MKLIALLLVATICITIILGTGRVFDVEKWLTNISTKDVFSVEFLTYEEQPPIDGTIPPALPVYIEVEGLIECLEFASREENVPLWTDRIDAYWKIVVKWLAWGIDFTKAIFPWTEANTSPYEPYTWEVTT